MHCVVYTFAPFFSFIAAKFDLSNFNLFYIKIKVTYADLLHNHSCISWEPNPFIIKAKGK